MKRILLFLSFITILFLASRCSPLAWKKFREDRVVSNDVGIAEKAYSRQITKASQYLATIPNNAKLPSFSVAVGHKGKVIWSEAVGFEDIKKEVPATVKTQYRIGSTSKAVTSVLTVRLHQKGLIDLEKNLNGEIENYPEKAYDYTTRNLMSHTAGLADYDQLRMRGLYYTLCNCHTFESATESLRVLNNVDLNYEPNTEYAYTSMDFILLSAYLEQLTETNFAELIDQELFDQLGMENTYPDRVNDQVPSTVFYDTKNQKYKKFRTLGAFSAKPNLSYKWAGGGIISTPSDLVKLGNAFLTDTSFVSKEIFELYTEPQLLNNGEMNEQAYALGWRHYKDHEEQAFDENIEIIHHGGVSKGSMNFLVLFPKHDFVINASINADPGEFSVLWNETMRLAAFFINDF